MKTPPRISIAAAAFIALGATAAAADETRIMGHVTLSLGQGEVSFGVRARTFDGNRDHLAVDLSTRLSGGGLDRLRLNGAPILYADKADGDSATPYVVLGIAGAALLGYAFAEAFADDFADAIEQGIEEHLED